MNINEMRTRLITLSRQGQGGYYTPEETDRFLNDAINDKYNEEKRSFELNGFISDNLSNFKTSSTITLTSGIGSKPANYDYRTNAATSKTSGIEVKIVPEGEWVERISDPIDVVSATNPICAIRDQITVYPTSLTSFELYYLKRPSTVVFGYTDDGFGNAVYNSGTSTDCDFPTSCHPDIILRALSYMGIALPDEVMMRGKQLKKSVENV
jgi:hypothetical protein